MIARLALDEEEDIFVEMAKAAAAESTPHLPTSEARIRRTFQRYLRIGNPTIFFADHRRDIAGFLIATMSDYRHVDGLYTTQEVLFVRPEKRGTRAAVVLMRELVRWSEMLGALEITGGNDNALTSERTARFLAHFGFERVGFFMRRVIANG